MTNELRITNGKVFDPANNIDGEVRDICIKDGRIVESVGEDATRINAHGNVVMPGGVDIHCHIAGPKVNLARKLQPEVLVGFSCPEEPDRLRGGRGEGQVQCR